VTGFATHFFPPVWIGEQHHANGTTKAAATNEITVAAKPLGAGHKGRKVIVGRYGFIGIETGDERDAVDALNRIMCVALLAGLDVRTVRRSELEEVEITDETFEISGLGDDVVTFDLDEGNQRVSEDQMRAILRGGEVLIDHPNLTNAIQHLLEAHTQFAEGENKQSYMLAWDALEIWLSRDWCTLLSNKKVPKETYDKITDERSWTPETIWEGLYLEAVLSEEDRGRLHAARAVRTDVVKRAYSPTDDQARELLDLAADFCSRSMRKWGFQLRG